MFLSSELILMRININLIHIISRISKHRNEILKFLRHLIKLINNPLHIDLLKDKTLELRELIMTFLNFKTMKFFKEFSLDK